MKKCSRSEALAYIISLKARGYRKVSEEVTKKNKLVVRLVKDGATIEVSHQPQGWFKVTSVAGVTCSDKDFQNGDRI